MKILIATLLLGALGAGSFQLAKDAPAASAPDCPQTCEASVTCTPEGTCVVTCEKPDGSTCRIEIDCDEDCSIVSCEGDAANGSAPAATSCDTPCATPCR